MVFTNDIVLAIAACVAVAFALAGIIGLTLIPGMLDDDAESEGGFAVALLTGILALGLLGAGLWGLGYLVGAQRTPTPAADPEWTTDAFGGTGVILGLITIAAAAFCTTVGFGLVRHGGGTRLWMIPAVGFALAGIVLGGALIASDFYIERITIQVVNGAATPGEETAFVGADGRRMTVSYETYDAYAGREFPFAYTCHVHVFPVVQQADSQFGDCQPAR